MNGIHPYPQADPEIRENWRTVNEVVDEEYYEGWIDPGAGGVDGAGAAVVANANMPYVLLPDGVAGRWKINLHLKRRWHSCGLYLKLWYTSGVGSTNAFGITLASRHVAAGMNLATGVLDPFAQAFTAAGPAAAQGILSIEYTNATRLFTSTRDLLSFRVARDGAADANNNELWLLLLYYKFLVI